MTHADEWQTRFRQIGETSVWGLPIYNNALDVEALAFQECEQGEIGLLIAPWFMNIVILPAHEADWCEHPVGDKLNITLANGDNDFVLGEDEQLGRYLFRTVRSPMNCFQDQTQARQAGLKALQALLLPEPSNNNGQQYVVFDKQPASESRRAFLQTLIQK